MEERLLVYNQDMPKPKIIHKDYSVCSCNYQFRLPLELEVLIPNDDPVRLLNVFVEGMELTDLYQTYGKIKKSQASPRQLFKAGILNAPAGGISTSCTSSRENLRLIMLPSHGSSLSIFPSVPKRPLLK